MQSRSLRGEQIDQLYQEHLCRDFPPDERKPLAQIHRAVDRGIYRVVGFYLEDTLCGYALLSVLPGRRFGFLDYFAVVPQMRGGGIGGQLLADLRRQMADLQGIFFEVEQPQSAPDPQQAGRRIRFYQRGGCRYTGVYTRLFGVNYYILYLPCAGDADDETLLVEVEASYRAMVDPALYDQKVAIWRQAPPADGRCIQQ